jgi:hypothetical protein
VKTQNCWGSGHCPSSGITKLNTTFRKLDLFPCSGEGSKKPTSWRRKQTQFPVSEMLCSSFFNSGSSPKSRTILFLSVIHHRQNPLDPKNKTSAFLSPRWNYTDWSTATWRNLMPTFADRGVWRGQLGISPMVVNLRFLDWSRYFSLQ